MKRETKGLLKERFIMKKQKDSGMDLLVEVFVLSAAVVVLQPLIVKGTGIILDGVCAAGQGVTNVVKNQIDKRKKKVEEVEED